MGKVVKNIRTHKKSKKKNYRKHRHTLRRKGGLSEDWIESEMNVETVPGEKTLFS